MFKYVQNMFNFAPFSSDSIADFEQVNVIQEDFSK